MGLVKKKCRVCGRMTATDPNNFRPVCSREDCGVKRK